MFKNLTDFELSSALDADLWSCDNKFRRRRFVSDWNIDVASLLDDDGRLATSLRVRRIVNRENSLYFFSVGIRQSPSMTVE